MTGGSEEHLARLIADGRVLPPESCELDLPPRVNLRSGSVEDLVREQRR